MLINFLDISNFLEVINIENLAKELANYLKNNSDDDLLNTLEDYFIRRDKDSVPTQDLQFNLGDETHRWKNIYAQNFNGTATSAKYADLAEKYIVKGDPKPGDVIIVSDDLEYEGEISDDIASYRIIGVVSENPAFKMNDDLKNGIYVALRGKVKCKVFGTVMKGDPLVSYFNGGAISINNSFYNFNGLKFLGRSIIGIALETVEQELNEFSYIKILI